MAQFIKTSQGFINLDRVELVDEKNTSVRIWTIGAQSPNRFEGDEAARLRDWFNRSAIFDATAVRDFEDDPLTDDPDPACADYEQAKRQWAEGWREAE